MHGGSVLFQFPSRERCSHKTLRQVVAYADNSISSTGGKPRQTMFQEATLFGLPPNKKKTNFCVQRKVYCKQKFQHCEAFATHQVSVAPLVPRVRESSQWRKLERGSRPKTTQILKRKKMREKGPFQCLGFGTQVLDPSQ